MASTDSDTLVIVATWTAYPGHEGELAALGDQAVAAAATFEGHLSGTVIRETDSGEFHFVYTFASSEAVDRWQDSMERSELIAAMQRIGTRSGTPQRITGLETWFATKGSARETIKPPPRWKMWLASFLGAYPLVVLFQWLLAPLVEDLPLLVRSALFPLVLLSLMTYAMMPFVTRVLHGWLYPGGSG